ncbi:MAG: phosphatase PAP2 family protein [Piscinibacter sp.]|nr:phosphatase PAP2 family protein [Piscinibacter sp.]
MTPLAPTRRGDIPAALMALLALLLWEASGWDLALSRQFGNPAGFVWRHAWLTEHLLHDGGRTLAGLLLALLAWDAWRPWVAGPTRRQRVYWLGVVALSMLLVPAYKRISTTSCPWDLAPFGGRVPYVPHWLPGVVDGGAGHCFPSGHAVAAFAFIGLYYLWRPYRPHAARRFLAWLLAAGTLFGVAQLVRGAHFASHTLWSAWLCWVIALLAERLESATHRRQHVDAGRARHRTVTLLRPLRLGHDPLEQRRQ